MRGAGLAVLAGAAGGLFVRNNQLAGADAAIVGAAVIAAVSVAGQVGVLLVVLEAHRASAWLAASLGLAPGARVAAVVSAIAAVHAAGAIVAAAAAVLVAGADAATAAWLGAVVLAVALGSALGCARAARRRGVARGRVARRGWRDRRRRGGGARARRVRRRRRRGVRRGDGARDRDGAGVTTAEAAPAPVPVLAIDRLGVRRGGRVILDGVSLAVAAGELVGLVGPSGCGKSTLLACVAGVLPPRGGSVRVAGASVWGGRRERARARRALGYVPETADPPGFLLGGELWAMCAAARGAEPPSGELRAALGLDELADLALERMSLGQRRRACLGAALLGPPALLVLDEPDNGLDVRRLDALAELVAAHAAGGGAAIVASHDGALLERVGARVHAMPARG